MRNSAVWTYLYFAYHECVYSCLQTDVSHFFFATIITSVLSETIFPFTQTVVRTNTIVLPSFVLPACVVCVVFTLGPESVNNMFSQFAELTLLAYASIGLVIASAITNSPFKMRFFFMFLLFVLLTDAKVLNIF